MAHKQGPHPRQQPRIPGELTLERVREFFSHSADFSCRELMVGEQRLWLCYLVGMVKSERLQDYVIRPILSMGDTGTLPWLERLEKQVIWAGTVQRRTTLDEVALDIVSGSCALFLPGKSTVLTVPVPTEDRRGVGEPDNEPALKGSRESFTEAMRINTSMLRRHLRAPVLRIEEQIVGRQSLTVVDVVYLPGMADPDVVRQGVCLCPRAVRVGDGVAVFGDADAADDKL